MGHVAVNSPSILIIAAAELLPPGQYCLRRCFPDKLHGACTTAIRLDGLRAESTGFAFGYRQCILSETLLLRAHSTPRKCATISRSVRCSHEIVTIIRPSLPPNPMMIRIGDCTAELYYSTPDRDTLGAIQPSISLLRAYIL
jgi:hypothetical protein